MKSKREILKLFTIRDSCLGVQCEYCPYNHSKACTSQSVLREKLTRIGAMALLRMFRRKKKPTLSVGTKIKFDDGRLAKIVGELDNYHLEFSNYSYPISYLIGTTWEVVPSEVEDD